MSSVQCPCGSWVSTANPDKGGWVRCPKCGQAVGPVSSPPPVYAGAPGQAMGYRPAQPSDNSGLIGFVLGLLGFFMCPILGPFAIYFSVKGLKHQDNRGLAIAGLIFGIIDLISLICLILYLIFIFVLIGGAVATTAAVVTNVAQNPDQFLEAIMDDEQMIAVNQAQLASYAQTIREFAESNGRMPSQIELEQIVGSQDDLWSRPFVVEYRESEFPLLMSLGKDGIKNSIDDIVYDWESDDGSAMDLDFDSEAPSPFEIE